MPFIRPALAAALTGLLLLVGCSQPQPPKPAGPKPPAGQTAPKPPHPELAQPFEQALLALKAMNETGKQKDFIAAQKHFGDYRANWKPIYAMLKAVDPKLAQHIEDGGVELDHEFTQPADQIRVYELDEETIKLGRLLSTAAEALNVPLRPDLVQKGPSTDTPFNKEVLVEVSLVDHKILPEVIQLSQHDKVTFVIINKGKDLHEFAVGHYAVGEEDMKPGETRTLTLVVLDAGEFETACHIPGHYEVGMFGKLVVKPAALQTK